MKQVATLFFPFLIMAPALSFTNAESQNDHPENAFFTMEAKLPADNLYQILAAEMALDREHPEIALTNYIAAAKETQDPHVAARATQIALSVASLEVAMEPAVIWAKTAPKDLEAQITTAALYIRLNKISEALPYLKLTQALNPEDALQYFLIIFKQLQKEEDSKRVINALQLLTEEPTKVPSAHLALSEIYLAQGKPALALTMSENALKITPGSVVGIQLHTESLFQVKGKEAAKVFLEKNVAKHPELTLLRQYYVQFLLDNGYPQLAYQQVSSLLQNPALNAQSLLQFARLCIQAQWLDLAEQTLKRASHFSESKDLSYYFLARVAEMRNQEGEAIEWFKQVLTGPFHVLSQIRASSILSDQKHYDEALLVLSHTQANDPGDNKQILLATVDILNKANRYPESLVLLDSSLKVMPEDIELLYARGLVADNLNQLDIAENDLKAILKIQPNHIDALNALGFMLANKTTRFNDAQLYLSQALTLSPNNPSVLDSIGWLFYKMGNYQKSATLLQKAVDLTQDAEIAAHLGEVLWKMKNFEDAKRVWKNALVQHPKHTHVINAMQRLGVH